MSELCLALTHDIIYRGASDNQQSQSQGQVLKQNHQINRLLHKSFLVIC